MLMTQTQTLLHRPLFRFSTFSSPGAWASSSAVRTRAFLHARRWRWRAERHRDKCERFYAYETLRWLYCRATGRAEVGPAMTLLIGSAAGAIASTAKFPLEVVQKQMQVGAVGGRQVYRNVLHAMYCILRGEGAAGLYRGLSLSCIKLMPAAGISFMCYEALKKILVEEAPALEAECVEEEEVEIKEKIA